MTGILGVAADRRRPVVSMHDDMASFRVFVEPINDGKVLPYQPRLESWERRDHPAQVALTAYLDDVDSAVGARLRQLPSNDLAIRLVVGLPVGSPLIGAGGDLDNYLFPVVRRLGYQRFVSAWATKRHGTSRICIDRAMTMPLSSLAGWSFAPVRTTASAETRAWKRQIASQLPTIDSGRGPVELQMCFRVGPRRNWTNVWKPAIDALGGILGAAGSQAFNPRDDRITRLGLHRNVDPNLDVDIAIGIWWRQAPEIDAQRP